MDRPPSRARLLRSVAALAALAALAACSGPRMNASQEASQYQRHARGNYIPPGPPGDPWGPYIIEASGRFDVPERWIREVIRAESSFKVMDTSQVGAMGLMQVMPATFDELRARYSLGDDPYEPHDNIMAGTAYLREMYDLYGNPGFLAAYNAGPGKLDDYLTRNKPLPLETRNYVAKIGPRIQGYEPNNPSANAQYAMNNIPINIPPGPRYPRHGAPSQAPVALADNRRTGVKTQPVQVASLSEPVRPQSYAAVVPPPPPQSPKGGFHLIQPAMAEPVPHHAGGPSTWAIQVGAYGNEGQARAAANQAREHAQLASAQTVIGTTKQANATLYRARVVGLTHESAADACAKMAKQRTPCIVLSPDAQS